MAFKRDIEREERHEASKYDTSGHEARTITVSTVYAERLGRGIVVAFEYVSTVPIVIDGRQLTAYVGVTRLDKVAHRGTAATEADVVDAASRLSWASD